MILQLQTSSKSHSSRTSRIRSKVKTANWILKTSWSASQTWATQACLQASIARSSTLNELLSLKATKHKSKATKYSQSGLQDSQLTNRISANSSSKWSPRTKCLSVRTSLGWSLTWSHRASTSIQRRDQRSKDCSTRLSSCSTITSRQMQLGSVKMWFFTDRLSPVSACKSPTLLDRSVLKRLNHPWVSLITLRTS
jgi:hypothetical protein